MKVKRRGQIFLNEVPGGVARGRRIPRLAHLCSLCAVLVGAWAFAFLLYPRISYAGDILFLGNNSLNKAFCHQKTFRKTVVYIDDMMMRRGDTSWVQSLAGKLEATLTPGERVSVVELSPAQGLSQEIWSGCWPNYPAQKLATLQHQSSFFSESPIKSLKNQQNIFMNAFGSALTKIYKNGLAQAHTNEIQPGHAPRKLILEALASDGGRFIQSSSTIRAIVYSDLAEHGNTWSVFGKSPTSPTSAGMRLGTSFRHTVFYFFGVGNDVAGDSGYLSSARRFWSAALASMQGTIEGIGSDLNVPNDLPVAAYNYSLSLNRNGTQLFGRASLLVDSDGSLVDSWIGINRLTFVGLTGTFQCHRKGNCRLRARTEGGLATDGSSESVDLVGATLQQLKGRVGVRGALTFPLIAKLTAN